MQKWNGWSKPMRWSDILRSLLIAGQMPDARMETAFALREMLKKRIDAGEVRQCKRGWYQLLLEPVQ
jgi:hypothetical protein